MAQKFGLWIAGAVLFALVVAAFVIAFLLPIVVDARENKKVEECAEHLKQLSAAIKAYEADYKMLPPAMTVDSQGNPMHSWRTLLLPYVGHAELYKKIDLSKPWNDPVNDGPSQTTVDVYSCPASILEPGLTTFKAVVDPSSMFPGTRSTRSEPFSARASEIAILYESDQTDAVHWMEPQDGSKKEFCDLSRKRSSTAHRRGHNVLMLDGSVRFLTRDDTEAERAVLMDRLHGMKQ